MADPANAGAVPFLVTVSDARAKRINVTLPESELEAIDAYARRHRCRDLLSYLRLQNGP